MPILVLRCKATSTTKKYLGDDKHWKAWAITYSLTAFLTNAAHIALYLQHLARDKGSKTVAEEAVNGLAWVHAMSGESSPTDSPMVQTTLGGLKRKLVNKKSPFTVEMLQIIAQDAQKQNTLASLRLVAACLLAFTGFLRLKELAELQLHDLTMGTDHLKLYITLGKTDQFRQGKELELEQALIQLLC